MILPARKNLQKLSNLFKYFIFRKKEWADSKSTPLKTPTYISRSSNIDPIRGALICSKICSKSSKISKKVNNEVICRINVISLKLDQLCYRPDFSNFWTNLSPISLLAYFFYFWTNLGPILVKIITYYTPPMLQISDFGRSDWYFHHGSYNYIIIPRKFRSKE